MWIGIMFMFFFKQKTAYEMRISDWSSDVCSSDLGDPPEDALGFVEFLRGRKAPRLDQLAFAVLGLGDSSYPQFCAVGHQLDQRLAELGATRLLDCAAADLDIDTVAAPWLDQAQARAEERLQRPAQRATVTPLRRAPAAPLASREQPFAAELLTNQRIRGRDSSRDVRHIELSLAGSGLHYQPGDRKSTRLNSSH